MMQVYANSPYSNLTPQLKTLLDHFHIKGTITNSQANDVHKIRSVAKRISELRELGYRINKTFHKDVTGQRYMKYHYDGWENPALTEGVN
jgi:hypothetical protein